MPFGAQIILNGHNYVARRATRAGVDFTKEGNCFTTVNEPARLARVADTLSRPAAAGRLRQVCDRWIYSAVLCFALSSDEQQLAGTALSPAPKGFTVTELAGRVHAMTGQPEADYTTRQAAYDLRKLRAKGLVAKPGRSRRYHVPPQAVRTITAVTTLRDQVLAPILAGIRSAPPIPDRRAWSAVEHDYETLRIDMETLFNHLGIATAA